MQQTWQANENLSDAWQNWKEFIIALLILLPIEIIGMIVVLVYNEYLFGAHFEKLDKYHKIAEWDIFIGTLILIVTNIHLLFVNYDSISQTRNLKKLKNWLIHHGIGLCFFLIISVNFQIVLRYMSVFHEYTDILVSVVSWTYFMCSTLWLIMILVYYISYKPIVSTYHRSIGNQRSNL